MWLNFCVRGFADNGWCTFFSVNLFLFVCFVDLHIANFTFTLKIMQLYCWRIWSIFAVRWVKRIIRKMYWCNLYMWDNLSRVSVGGATAGYTGTAIIQQVSQGQQGVLRTQVCLSGSEQKNPPLLHRTAFLWGLSLSWQTLVKIPIPEKYCPLFI